jgi:hypothetical protein
MMEGGDSLSGEERNHLFWNRGGVEFEDLSGLTGLDSPADGRAVSALDFDRDGWVDFAVVSANTPLLQLFRNRIGETRGAQNEALALRFVGANRSSEPKPGASNRDGYGVRVEVRVGASLLVHEHRAGEGLASQNSATILVGLGARGEADGLRVRWPSGRVQERTERVPAWSLVTVYEDPSESSDGSGFEVEPYRVAGAPPIEKDRELLRLPSELAQRPQSSALQLWTTMASWCEVCKGELPQVALLRNVFGNDELALYGVPVDQDDDTGILDAYRRENEPAYELLEPLSSETRSEIGALVREQIWIEALPATLVTDPSGRVLHVQIGLPSVSDVRRWLATTMSDAS